MRKLMLLATATLICAAGTSNWGFDTSGEDRAVVPGNNFYDFANGTAVKNLVIPPDQSRYGAFNVLRDLSEARTKEILEQAAAKANEQPSDTVAKTGAFYKSFMDQTMADKLGAAPLKADLDLIRAVQTPRDFAALAGRAPSTMLGAPFDLSIQPDAKDPTKYAIYMGQSGLGLPDRDYYLTPDFADARAKYPAFVEKMLSLAGWPDAHARAADIIAFEAKIAAASWSRAEQRDDVKTYNPMSVADLAKAAPGFDWSAFFNAAGLGQPARVIVSENTAAPKIAALIGATPVATLQAWAAFHLALNTAPLLSNDFVDTDYQYLNHTLEGQPEQKPRWKRAVHTVESVMGEAIGKAYVARYFPPDSREKMQFLTTALHDAFRHRLEKISWMSAATRQKALEKLATFDFQVGYPKHWRDYRALVIRAGDLYGNVERGTAFEWQFWLGHLGHPVDRDQWEMFPQTVNAYNEPLLNEVVFPAAILQPPFFDPHADPAVNFGAIGGVIGHEMTHSFDDQGRQHDAKGRLSDWWTKQDADRFNERAKRYGEQFAAMDLPSGGHINPALTMGENIADLGGLTLALDAYHASLNGKPAPVIEGTTGDQRVFLGWAQVWRGKSRDAAARKMLTIDPHSPPIARVNEPVRNIDAWYAAFDVKPGDKLYLAPADRVKIW
jgi:putative endopeptidase